MDSKAYRILDSPVAPDTQVANAEMCIIKTMPMTLLNTQPSSGLGRPISVRRHASSGQASISSVHISFDFGASCASADVTQTPDGNAWQRFNADVTLPSRGQHEIWARAIDAKGRSQPMTFPG